MNTNIEFTEQELNIMINALVQRPYGEVINLLNNIQKQISKAQEIVANPKKDGD